MGAGLMPVQKALHTSKEEMKKRKELEHTPPPVIVECRGIQNRSEIYCYVCLFVEVEPTIAFFFSLQDIHPYKRSVAVEIMKFNHSLIH